MAETKFIDVGGLKLFDSRIWSNQEEFIQVSANGATTGAARLKSVVPWLAKATDMTANAISELPFDITGEDGKVLDDSADWKDKLGGIPNPQSLFYKLAASLCTGRAYLIPTVTSRAIVNLQYCAPHTVTPFITAAGLQHFQRTSDEGATGNFQPAREGNAGEMMYFWLPDSDVEIGPALSTPASTALLSAQMLVAMDASIRTISERGFISPTVLMAKGMSNKEDRKEAENWWNKFIRGWTNSIAKILNGEAMTIQKIGAAMDELRGVYPELSKQAIENIGTAYGIPAALFMSDMAFASEVNPMIKVWYTTSAFVKIYHVIEETFNTQLLNRFKCKLRFKPETIDAFQEDEATKATALNSFADFLVKMPTAEIAIASCETFGYELSDNLVSAIKKYYSDKEKRAESIQANITQAETPAPEQPPVQPEQAEPDDGEEVGPVAKVISLDAAQIKDLDLWRQVAVRNFKKGKGAAIDFKCGALPAEIAEGIRERLRVAINEGEIVKAFEINAGTVDTTDQIKRALDWLESHDKEK